MKNSNSLYKLIISLTRTEKAYFKKYASRHVLGEENKYVILFNEIAGNLNGYNEKEIKNKLRYEKFVKNFPVIKKYLYQMILRSLNSFYSNSSLDNEIKNEIRHIEILYKKSLYKSCESIIERSLKQAYKIDNFFLILELLKWKKNLINVGALKRSEYIKLENASREELEVINKIKNLSDYRFLSYRVRSLIVGSNPYHTGENIKKELLNILNEPLLKSEKEALSYPAIIMYYHILADVNDSLFNNREAFECRKMLVTVTESRPEILKVNISNYIVFVFNLLGTCLNLKTYNELEYYIKKLRLMEKTYPGKYSENDRLLVFMGSFIFELRMHVSKGEFSKSIGVMLEFEKRLMVFEKEIVRIDLLYFFFLLGYSYFGAGKFNEALIWINKIINDKDVIQDRKLFVKSKMLNLILHYELGNFELLDYLVKSTYRFLMKNKISSYDEKIAIRFLKQLPGISSQKQLLNLFSECLHKLKSNQQNNNGDVTNSHFSGSSGIRNNFTNIAELDLISWLESKISGKRFEDIVRTKHSAV